MSKAAVIEANEQATPIQKATGGVGRLMEFFHDTREEMKKVTTPSRAEVQSTTVVVIVAVFLFAGYFALVDFVIGNTLDKWFLHLTKH